jgi:hypothetical protein
MQTASLTAKLTSEKLISHPFSLALNLFRFSSFSGLSRGWNFRCIAVDFAPFLHFLAGDEDSRLDISSGCIDFYYQSFHGEQEEDGKVSRAEAQNFLFLITFLGFLFTLPAN